MSQHGRRRAAPPPPEPRRRFAGLSVETTLVLLLVCVIAGGSALVHAIAPTEREPQTVVGDEQVRVTTVGKGGVLPGPVQPRVIPVVVPTSDPATEILIPPQTAPQKVKKQKPPKVVETPTPTPTPEPTEIPILTPPGGGGGGGGGNDNCTLGILCPRQPEPAAPEPAAPPDEGTPTGEQPGRQDANPGAQPEEPVSASAETPAPTDPR